MQAAGTTHLLPLLAAVALVAGASGFLGAVAMRRKSRRTRTIFTLGFVCGATAVAIFDVRRRGISALGTTYRRLGLGSRTRRAVVGRRRPLPRRVNGLAVDTMWSLRRAHTSLKDAVLMSSAGK
jgi:hypothetical protein